MRNLLSAILIIFCCNGVIAQATTEMEYNYMKKGYRQVEENGNDVKRGYYTEVLPGRQENGINVSFTKLIREKDKSLAGIIVKTVSGQTFGSGTNYYCIPAVSLINQASFGWREFNNDVVNMTTGVKNIIFGWLAYQLSYEMYRNRNVKNINSNSLMDTSTVIHG